METNTAATECSTRFCNKRPTANGMCSECCEEERRAEKLKPVIQAFIDSIEVPGFVKTTGEGHHTGMGDVGSVWDKESPWWRKTTWVRLFNEEAGVSIAINVSRTPSTRYKAGKKIPFRGTLEDIAASGHTCYKNEAGSWLSFDRRGVEDSFYLGDYSPSVEELPTVIQEQLERIAKSKETSKKMLSIPGFGFRIHQDNLEAVKKKLQTGGSHSFTPSGFGTGHVLRAKKTRYSKQLSAETAAFFGVPAIYDETFDHD